MYRSWIMSNCRSNVGNATFMDAFLETVLPTLSQRKGLKRVGTKSSDKKPIIKGKNREDPLEKALNRPMFNAPLPKRRKDTNLTL